MMTLALVLFWVSVTWLVYVYAGYPAVLWIIGFWRQFVPETRDDYFPRVSILISARNEEKDILWKVNETLSWNYPADRLELLIASDASEDRTDELLRSVRDPRLKFIRLESRVGKNEALNRLVQRATGELLLFSDANSHISKDCLRSMVRYFADSRVGSVTGTEHTRSEEDVRSVSSGTRAYLDYEFMVSRLESRVGSVIVCDGSLFAIRRSLYHELQPDLANDLELPLYIGARGYKLLCDPSAWALEKAMRSPQEEFNRKRRICGQGVLGFWRLRSCLRGFRAWQFLSRKVLRWLSLVPMIMIFLATIALRGQFFFKFFLVFEIAFCATALLSVLLSRTQLKVRGLLAAPFYFLLVNLAAITGVWQACTGRRFAVWDVAVLSRGQENA